jgi:hypothetical protein
LNKDDESKLSSFAIVLDFNGTLSYEQFDEQLIHNGFKKEKWKQAYMASDYQSENQQIPSYSNSSGSITISENYTFVGDFCSVHLTGGNRIIISNNFDKTFPQSEEFFKNVVISVSSIIELLKRKNITRDLIMKQFLLHIITKGTNSYNILQNLDRNNLPKNIDMMKLHTEVKLRRIEPQSEGKWDEITINAIDNGYSIQINYFGHNIGCIPTIFENCKGEASALVKKIDSSFQ